MRNYSTTVSGTAYNAGANVGISVTYTLVTYIITFQQTGLSTGTTWYVNVSGVTVSSTGPTITFQKPNGTYTYTANASGYNTTTRSIVVNGASPATVAVSFSSTASSNAISWTTWIIIIVVIIIIIVVVVALLMRGRGGAQKPSPPT